MLIHLTISALLGLLMPVTLSSSRMAHTSAGSDSHSVSNSRPAAPVKYRIDPSKSRFIVRAFAGGLLSAFAHDHTIAIKDFSGEASFEPGSFAGASLWMNVKSDSLVVTDKVSDSDRKKIEGTMRTEVLETQKYPEITFKSTRVTVDKLANGEYLAKIWGDLTLHGVTRNGLIQGKLKVNDNVLVVRGEFPLKQSEYQIKPVSVAGGTIKVKDDLKFSFEITAVK